MDRNRFDKERGCSDDKVSVSTKLIFMNSKLLKKKCRAPDRQRSRYVKRVIGVEGDLLMARNTSTVFMQSNKVWVEGDNGAVSHDSNHFGPLPLGLIFGKVRYIVWPLSRFGPVPTVDSFKSRILMSRN